MTDWMQPGNNAVITGGASGIGLSAARLYLENGMNVLIADLNEEALGTAAETLAGIGGVFTVRIAFEINFEIRCVFAEFDGRPSDIFRRGTACTMGGCFRRAVPNIRACGRCSWVRPCSP